MGTEIDLATDLLERDGVLERTRRVVEAARDGSGATLVIEGKPGTGKTAVLATLRQAQAGPELEVLHASGDELETELPFGVVRQLFARFVRELGGGSLLSGPAALAATALGLSPPSPALDPLGQALHGLHWLTLDLAERRGPLVLVVDDAHWADAESARFLAYLSRRLDGARVALLVARRPGEGGVAEFLDGIRGADDPARLGPLSEAAGEIVIRAHREDADAETCRACHEATGGNPFLLTEIATALRDHHGPLRSGDPLLDVAEGTFGGTVRRRLDGLGEQARGLAEAVSLFPDGAELRHAAAIAELPLSSAIEAADVLEQSLILRRGRPMAFRHALLRAAVLSGVPPRRRALHHGQIADLLIGDGVAPEYIATHLLAAEPAGRSDWADLLIGAAAQAAAAGAAGTALRLLDRAAAEPPAPERRIELQLQRGLAELATGAPASADTLLSVVRQTEDPGARIPLVFPLAHAMAMVGRFSEIVPVLEAEADTVAAVNPDLALRLRAEAYWIAWQHAPLRDTAERLLGLTPEDMTGATLSEQIALSYRAQDALARLRPAAEILELATRAAVGTELADHGLETGAPVSFAVTALAVCDRHEEARQVLRRSEAAFHARGELVGLPMVHAQHAWIELLAGDLAAAEAVAETALAALDTQPADHLGRPWVMAMLGQARLERGDIEGALAAVGDDEPGDASSFAVTLLATRGEIRFAAGDLDGALADLERAAGWCEGQGFGEPAGEEIFRRRELALLRLRRGERGAARALASRVLEEAKAVGAARLLGESLRVHGIATGDLATLESATEVLRDSPGRLAEAKALAAYGAALRRANQRAAAREPLRRALDLAQRCGAERLAGEVEVDLRATGARPRRRQLTGAESLTPSERRVATLAAAGRTNREIAQELFVTLRTVEMHLSNSFRKLDVTARGELGERL